jgi:hypothetical protein
MHSRDRVSCTQCGETIDARAPGVAQRVQGWRVNRAQGGANMIALAQPMHEYLCRFCLDKRRSGVTWDQPSLFDES